MTTVTCLLNGRRNVLKVSGHAGYAKDGEPDIVCASVSMLSCTLLQCLADEDAAGRLTMFTWRQESGYVEADALAEHEAMGRVRVIYETVLTGYRMLAEKYPGVVRVVEA